MANIKQIHCVIKLILFILPQLSFSEPFVLRTCCKFQSSYFDGKCADMNILQNRTQLEFGKEFMWEFNVTKENVSNPVKFSIKNTFPDFTCKEGLPEKVSLTTKQTVNTTLFSDGYLRVNNLILPPKEFCIDKVETTPSLGLSLYVCTSMCNGSSSSLGECLPKCCPWQKASRWLHPEICMDFLSSDSLGKRISNLVPSNRTKENQILFNIQSVNCTKQGRMISTVKVDVFNRTNLRKLLDSMKTDSYCFDDVTISHDISFSWIKNQALFFCGKKWPVEEFGLTVQEKKVYGICTAVSTFFLIISIGTYYIKLHRTYTCVHTWLEFFYMISLFLFGIFMAVQVYFPENQIHYCSLYRFTAIFGNTVFGISLFSWATLLSSDIFIAFKELRPVRLNPQNESDRLIVYSLIGFGFPIIISLCTFAYSHHHYWDKAGYCIPVQYKAIRTIQGFLFAINLFFFLATFFVIMNHKRITKFAKRKTEKKKNQLIICFIKLFIISGITYGGVIVGFVSGSERDSSWYLVCFRAFLMLRGVTLFFTYVCNKQMKKVIFQRANDGLFCGCAWCKANPKMFDRFASMRSTLTSTYRRKPPDLMSQ